MSLDRYAFKVELEPLIQFSPSPDRRCNHKIVFIEKRYPARLTLGDFYRYPSESSRWTSDYAKKASLTAID